MFAPLALKCVFSSSLFRWLISFLRRIPVQAIQINTTTPRKASPQWPHAAPVAKLVIGAVAALLLVIGILAFILWRRRRSNIGESPATSSVAMWPASGTQLTPFIPRHLNATHGDQEPWMESQEPHAGPSSSFVPIGLSSKELARIRAETLRPRLDITHPESDESQSQSPPSPVVSSQAGLRAATSPPTIRTGQSQFDRFWREIHQVLVERLGLEAPPSYTEGDVRERVE
jgi:hypothetical protein